MIRLYRALASSSDQDRPGVPLQPLRPGQVNDGVADSQKTFWCKFLKCNGFHKAVERESAVGSCITRCRKGMVGARSIVPGTLWGIGTEKDRSRVRHFFRQFAVIAG